MMLSTAFLSMWISNTATTVLMLPIALSVLNLLKHQTFGRLEITYFIPSLSAIFDTFLEIAPTKVFIKAVSETGYAFLAGTFYAVVIGVPTGILMGKNRILQLCVLLKIQLLFQHFHLV